MRLVVHDGTGVLKRGLLALSLLAVSAGSAAAQLVFDGNLLFDNNATGTLAGQFIGTAPGAAAGCAAGMNAAVLGTTTFTHNAYADPLLPNAAYKANVVPSFQPGLGSPAWGNALTVPNDGFFTQVCYKGAIGPRPGDDWTAGWTNYDSTGATRQDLHLQGMPDPRPLAIYDNIKLYSPQTWAPDSNYEIRGQLRIKDQSSLTIPAGVVVFQDRPTLGTLIVERGGKVFAVGTAQAPIIFTSNETPGSQTRGSCGGIILNGRAKTSTVNSCAGDSAASEGGQIGYYGGSDDDDDSGQLRYVRVEFSGKEITPNNELNSFLFNAIGRNTQIDYLQAFMGADDCFEFFGGTAQVRHLIGIDGTDDGFDWGGGFRGRAQFVILRQSPRFAPSGTQNGDKGVEADNNEAPNAFDQIQCAGRANPTLSNFTIVGDHRRDATNSIFPGPVAGLNLRRATAGTVLNSIVYNFKTGALKIDDDITWQVHCAAIPSGPAVYCPGALDAPIAVGNVLVARSMPNPFRNHVNFAFTLPASGRVSIEIYAADGRRVQTLEAGELAAGPHSIAWSADRSTPSGVYFYKVVAGGGEATGKIARVD